MSIVGGGAISSGPFGHGRPGIYISKVTINHMINHIYHIMSVRLYPGDQLTGLSSSEWETGS